MSSPAPGAKCGVCFDTGLEVVRGKGARRCKCRLPRARGAALDRIPPRYAGVTLAGLRPREDLHWKQREVVPGVKEFPNDNHLFCGKADTGKTHFLYALYQHAASQDRRVVAVTMSMLVELYKAEFERRREAEDDGARVAVPVRSHQLDQKAEKWTLCIDDIDKATPTKYVLELMFNLFNAAYNNKHQVVVTTQLDVPQLIEHFDSFDGDLKRYGHSIVRRIYNPENLCWRMF